MFEPRFPTVVDSTMLNAAACPQRFFWEFVLRLRPAEKSPHLHAGGCMAKAFETTRRALYEENLPLADAIDTGLAALTTEWGDYNPPGDKTLTNCANAFIGYFQRWQPETDLQPHRHADGTIAAEYSFALPLPVNHPDTGSPLLYGGRFDFLAILHDEPVQHVIIDEKTTSRLGPQWGSKWKLRGQFLGYTWALQQDGKRVAYCEVRGLRITRSGSGRPEDYASAIMIPREHLVASWYEHTCWKLQRLVETYRRWKAEAQPAFVWPRAYGELCESYDGCSYMDLCASQEPQRYFSQFHEILWNPVAPNPETRLTPHIPTEGTLEALL